MNWRMKKMFKMSMFERMVKMALKGIGDDWHGNQDLYDLLEFLNGFMKGVEDAKEQGFVGASVEMKFKKKGDEDEE